MNMETFLFVLFTGTVLNVQARECGNLTIRNKILTAGTTVEIQFIPSKEWLFPSIVQRGLYRWIYRNNTKLYLLFKNTTNEYDNRLSEDNFTLKIKNVQSRDEGEYKVECRTDKAIATTIMYFNTKYVDLKLQEPFSTSTSTVTATKQVESSAQAVKTSSSLVSSTVKIQVAASADNMKPEITENNTTTAVVGVITAIVALTVISVVAALVRKRRTMKKEHNKKEESAGIIDDNIGNDYAVVNDPSSLPDHSLDANHLLIDKDNYSSINQSLKNSTLPFIQQQCSVGFQNVSDEYAQVIPKSKRQNSENRQNSDQSFLSEIEEYAVVIPKSARSGRQCDNNSSNTKITGSCDKDEYATVASKSDSQALGEDWRSAEDARVAQGTHYSNNLPRSVENLTADSQCEYSQAIPKTQRLLDIHGIDMVQTKGANEKEIKYHEYDTPSPIVRRKTGVKELQYAELDHSDTSSYRSQSTESLTARPIEYVDIDFTKKAFVAPKRYPPPPSPKQNN